MNFFRELVSGKKQRFKDNQYNLDLTYITSRIIVMSYPASGFEAIYRNPINQVSAFLRQKHDKNYKVFNLSGRQYDYLKFNNNVQEYNWKDHHSPNLQTLFLICQQMYSFLNEKQENVIIVHCLAGKGRSGTAICCFLLYCGRFTNVDDSLTYYALKRFQISGLGVTQPSQIRYVQYFYQMFQNHNQFPNVKVLTQIKMNSIPSFTGNKSCRPYFKIYQIKNNSQQYLIFTSKKQFNQQQFFKNENNQEILININRLPLVGDILIKFKNHGYYKNKLMFRIAFNSSFISQNKLKLNLLQIDPDSNKFNKKFQTDFNTILFFEELCQCNEQISFQQKCQHCLKFLQPLKDSWYLIQVILSIFRKQ